MKSLVFLLVFFVTLDQHHAAPLTSCVTSADYCNPNWTPVNNMVSALQGYNIREGDPTSNYDPGFQQQIFQPTIMRSDGRIELEAGITASDLSSCKTSLNTLSFTTLESYRSALTTSSSTGVDLQVGTETEVTAGIDLKGVSVSAQKTIPPPFTRAWGDSKSIKDAAAFFTQEKGMISTASGYCFLHEIKINTFSPPPFTDSFKEALGYLHSKSQSTSSEKIEAFKTFIRAYGTHFQSRTKLGAQIAYRTMYSSKIRQEISATTLQQCNYVKGAKVFGIQVEQSSSSCSEKDLQSLGQYDTENIKVDILTKGSRPESNINDWAKQSFTPVPISFQLSPIVNLFKKGLIDDKGLLYNGKQIVASKIRDWFVPLYFDYCNTMGIDCSEQNSGCGINDQCSIDKICVDKSNSQQQCLSMFTCETKTTPFNDEGGGKVAYLDRHELACGENQAISYFKLERAGGRYRYVYKCCSTQLPCAQVNLVENSYTDANDAYYLDRQNVDCSSKYINKFKLNTSGGKLRYTYSCCHIDEEKECYDFKNTATDSGSGNAVYLDRQEVSCKNLYTLTQFRLQRESSNIYYIYKCCRTTPQLTTKKTFCKPTYTAFNSDGNGEVYYLDRHNLNCENGMALNSFKLERDGASNYRYAGACCTLPKAYTNRPVSNLFTDVKSSQAVYLDRQVVSCKDNFITGFQLKRQGDKVGYSYICGEKSSVKSCYETSTSFETDGGSGGNAVYLDRHNVACSDGYFLSTFNLIRSNDFKQWRYNFRCCKEA